MWEPWTEVDDRGDGRGDMFAGGGVGRGIRNRAVLRLQSLQIRGGRLERQPRSGDLDAAVLDDLGLTDDRLVGTGGGVRVAGHVGTSDLRGQAAGAAVNG